MRTNLLTYSRSKMIVKGHVALCRVRQCEMNGSWAVVFPVVFGEKRRAPEHYTKWAIAMNEYREEDRKVRENATQS